MENDQISQILTIILVFLIIILFILLTVFIILTVKKRKDNKPKKEEPFKKDKKIDNKKKESGYNKQSIFEFMEFDRVEDNMIVRKNGNKYIMAIECQGINYDLMSGLEKNSVEQGFLQFLNTLRYPIQLYIQTRTVNLKNSIDTYKERIKKIKSEYARKQMEYNSVINASNQSPKMIEKYKLEMLRAQNLYEYGVDIIQNTEKMNFNKNILRKSYYIIISYIPEDITKTDYNFEEIKNMAFSELYTRAQAIISSLSVCDIKAKVLDSKELIELLYIAYNRDEAEIYELEQALNFRFDELYSTAPNVMEKRMKELDKEIQRKAMEKANEVVRQAIDNREEARKVREKEDKINQMIDIMAKSILEENKELIGEEIKEEAEKIINSKGGRKREKKQ